VITFDFIATVITAIATIEWRNYKGHYCIRDSFL